MRSVAAVALTAVALVASGCAARSEQRGPGFAEWREALTLSLAVPPIAAAGAQADVRFRLENSGPRLVTACIGLARSISLIPEDDTQGNEPIPIVAEAVGLPSCRQRFRLAPGAHRAWKETTRLPGIVRGFARISGEVQIVDPSGCGRAAGCPALMLSASATIEIR
jgi:hypothetical protein